MEQNLSEKTAEIRKLNLYKHDTVAVILVLAGVKPATEIMLFKMHSEPDEVIPVLKNCGFGVIKYESQHMLGGDYKCTIIVAQNDAIAEEVRKYCEPQDDREFGRLMGIPQTAIDAFVSDLESGFLREGKSVKLLPADELLNLKVLAGFRLSRDHWQEEIKILQKWEEVIKTYAEDLLVD